MPTMRFSQMAEAPLNQRALKQTLKEALAETLHEQRELLHEVFTEVLEDAGLTKAIQNGRKTPLVTREEALGASRRKR